MRPCLAILFACTALAGCGEEAPRLAPACLEGSESYARALGGAPGDVRLEDGTLISECIDGARSNAQLQSLGLILTPLSDELAERAAREQDREAAVQLGFLGGAVRRGAGMATGVGEELARRVARSAFTLTGGPQSLRDAVEQGRRAGQSRG